MGTVVTCPHCHQVIAFFLEWEIKIDRKVTEDALLIILLPLLNPQLQLLRQNIELKGVKLTQDDFSAPCFFGILALLEIKEHLFDKVRFIYLLEV